MADLCDRKIAEDKKDLMLWLDFYKILKILIGDENMETFMEDASYQMLRINQDAIMKVRIFL